MAKTKPPAAPDIKPGLPDAPKDGAVRALRISAKREGFRRAGRAWSVSPTEVLLAELTENEIAMLKAEMIMLTVEEINLP